MADTLKVLMMGGPRSGKTSALAGLVDIMINGEVKNLLCVKDVSEGFAVKQKLAQKVENLKLTLIQSFGKTIIVDDSKTDAYQHYIVEFAIPGTKEKMQIKFTDANGEFFESGREQDSEISSMVKEYDVFLIAIDTPGLMEAINSNNTLMNEAVNRAINNVNDIHNFITHIDDKDGLDAKMVIFVPLKCEKWAREGKLEDVSNRVKDVYASPIEALMHTKNVQVDILPVQTVGNIVFSEHRKSHICISEEVHPKRCSLISENTAVRFADGYQRSVNRDADEFVADSQAVLREGSSIVRPNSWFKVVSKEYAPHNCEQLAYYILQFVLSKYLFTQKEKKRLVLLNPFRILPRGPFPVNSLTVIIHLIALLIKYMGSMTTDKLEEVLNIMKERNLIKTSGEGICRIKQSLINI